MRCCTSSSSGCRAREVAAAGAVRKDAVVEGVRGPHPSSLERRRDVVHARGEACLRPVHDALRYPTCPSPARACSAERVRPLPRLGAAPGGAALAGRRSVPLQPVRARRARASRARRSPRPRASVRARPPRPGHGSRSRPRGAARRWLLGRLRARSCIPRRAEPRRRRVLDGRHGRDPARAPRSPRSREAAGRLCRDRPSGATRAAPRAGGEAALRRRVPAAPHHRRVRLGRGGGAAGVARRRRSEGRVRRFRRRHGALSSRPGRAAGWTTSSRSERIRDATSRFSWSSPDGGPNVSFRIVASADNARALRPAARERAARGRRAVQSGSRMSRPGPSRRAPGAREHVLRARPRRCCRPWRARSRSLSRERPRSRAGTTSRTAPTAASCPRATSRRSSRRSSSVLDDQLAGRRTGLRARETVERNLTWARLCKRDPTAPRRRCRPSDGLGMTLRGAYARARRATGAVARERTARRSTSFATGDEAVQTSRSSTSSLRLRPAEGISSCARSSRSSSGAGSPSSSIASRRGRRPASSTRSTSTSGASADSPATTCASCIASTGRSGRTAGSTTGPMRGSRRSTVELADATIVQSRYSLDAHRSLGIDLADPRLDRQRGRSRRSSIRPPRASRSTAGACE